MKLLGAGLILLGIFVSGRAMQNSETAAKYGEEAVPDQAFSNVFTEGCLGWLIGMSMVGLGIYILTQ